MIAETPIIKKSKLPAILIIFTAVLTAALLPLRIFQTMTLVEGKTGFWINAEDRSVYMLYALLALLIVTPLLLGLVRKKHTMPDFGFRPRVAEGLFAASVAVALVLNAVSAFRSAAGIFTDFGAGIYVAGLEYQTGASVLQYFTRSGAIAALLEGVFGAVSALFFVSLAFCDWLPKEKKQLNRLLLLAPLAWTICRILRRFARMISYLRVSDLFLDLLMLSCLLLFFLTFAQVFAGISDKHKAGLLFGAGIPAAVLGMVCFVPRFIVQATGGGASLSQDAPVEWCDAALALFIAVFLTGRILISAQKSEIPAKTEEGSQA
ncbi:MAG: hypothetical protein LBB67_00845 [Oscillospiraceae bacterium]|jgi:hypothetical protein|nr:hypothetical protein [Oscillospiraceae bacterium]